jgi:hypothetical protein
MVGDFSLIRFLLRLNNQPPPLLVSSNCTSQCFPYVSVGRIIPLITLFCCFINDSFQGGNCQSNRFFTWCISFNLLVNNVTQQLKNYISNSNFTVKEWGYIIGEWYKGPPWSLFYSELWFIVVVLGNQSTLNIFVHHPHLPVIVHEFALWQLAQHTPPSGHRLCPQHHCLESQVAGHICINGE